MSWSIGYDSKWSRDVGYGVPAVCDHPECNEKIVRGLSYVCGSEPYGGTRGCGLYFCSRHLSVSPKLDLLCEKCYPRVKKPFKPKADHPDWIHHKLTDSTWEAWRQENPEEVKKLNLQLKGGKVEKEE